MPSAGFEPAVPAIKRLQTYALACTATRIGRKVFYENIIINYPEILKPSFRIFIHETNQGGGHLHQ